MRPFPLALFLLLSALPNIQVALKTPKLTRISSTHTRIPAYDQGYEALKRLLSLPTSSSTSSPSQTRWKVILGCRDPTKASSSSTSLHYQIDGTITTASSSTSSPSTPSGPEDPPHQVNYEKLDLAQLSSVKSFAQRVEQILLESSSGESGEASQPRLDVLVINAGMISNGDKEGIMGWKEDLVVNHLSQHYLIHLLLPYLRTSRPDDDPSRIVFVSSKTHFRVTDVAQLPDLLRYGSPFRHDSSKVYSSTKFVQMLSARYWDRVLSEKEGADDGGKEGGSVRTVTVSPGFVPSTGLGRNFSVFGRFAMSYILQLAPFATSPQQGGWAIYNAITVPESHLADSSAPATDSDEPVIGAGESSSDVRRAPNTVYLDKDGTFLVPDKRTDDVDLQGRWCPSLEDIENGVWTPDVVKGGS